MLWTDPGVGLHGMERGSLHSSTLAHYHNVWVTLSKMVAWKLDIDRWGVYCLPSLLSV